MTSMTVVADASPFVALVKIGRVELMQMLFGEVLIPPAVAAELAHERRPQAVRDFIGEFPPWLRIQAPVTAQSIAGLDEGECAAISLALELKDCLLVIDERLGRMEALNRKIRITGTIGILKLAAERKLVDLEEAFADLKTTNFRLSAGFLDAELEMFLQAHPDQRR